MKHWLINCDDLALARKVRDALYAYKRPVMTISFEVRTGEGGEHGVWLEATAPVNDSYVHACVGFANGYKQGTLESARRARFLEEKG